MQSEMRFNFPRFALPLSHCIAPLQKTTPQAASSVLAACTTGSSSGPTGKFRHRVRSLPESTRFTPDNGSSSGGAGSGTSRGGASGTGGIRGSASKGRNRGSGTSSTASSRGALMARSFSTVGTPESAPRSGSSLVEPSREGGGTGAADVAPAGGVVKRGGNLRWLSPTHLAAGAGAGAEVRHCLNSQENTSRLLEEIFGSTVVFFCFACIHTGTAFAAHNPVVDSCRRFGRYALCPSPGLFGWNLSTVSQSLCLHRHHVRTMY